jgi:lipid-binding SYLF domain-containing protein
VSRRAGPKRPAGKAGALEDHEVTPLHHVRRPLIAVFGLITAAMSMAVTDAMWTHASTEQERLVEKARLTVEAFAADPSQQDLRQWVSKSKALFIVPEILRGAFVFGGAGGGGVLLVRDERSGEWSQPVFYNIGAVSFGLQAGADASELIMVVRTQKGLEEFYRSDFKLGADVGVSIGSLGSSASMEGITADLVSFGRSKGAFMGMALNGALIAVSDASNETYYGKPVRPTDILLKKTVSNPASTSLRDGVAALGSRK